MYSCFIHTKIFNTLIADFIFAFHYRTLYFRVCTDYFFYFKDARVMSWWDYGYQITAMANRTILVDNNTWNNTHISRVGQAMASSEEKAYEIMQELDVDYVLVIFGGLTGYSSDGIFIFAH